MVDGREPGMIRHDDRDFVVNIAVGVASKNDDEICVFASDGRHLYTQRFKNGVVVLHGE